MSCRHKPAARSVRTQSRLQPQRIWRRLDGAHAQRKTRPVRFGGSSFGLTCNPGSRDRIKIKVGSTDPEGPPLVNFKFEPTTEY